MKMSRLLAIIAVAMALVLTFAACDFFKPDDNETTPPANNQTTPPTNTETTPPANTETTPVISVVPETVEIHAGDEIELMFGVTVTDEGDEAPTLIIEDDEGFDADVEGTYTITYKAVNKYGKTATATRTVKVLKALSALTLEVKANRLGENKWQGNLLSFKNKEFVTISGDYVSDVAISGVFYNATDAAVTINIAGSYGVAAVIDANGFVIEGRDGANSKLVNAANPDRTASAVTSLEINDETVTVASAFAKNLTVPAGGYAIVVQNGYCGTTVDSDGRGFMNYNVIYQYGNVVRLLWADTQEVLTPYVDQAPVITGHNNKVFASLTDSSFDLATGILDGLIIEDDNGTFDPSDDVKFNLENETIIKITVDNNGGFDVNTIGIYTVTLTATDGKNTVTVTRQVEVVDTLVELTINGNSYKTLPETIAVDTDINPLGKYLFLIFTPAYEGEITLSNGYGVAMVLNQYGQIVRIYDGASGKYFDAENDGITNGPCTATGYLKEAFASLQDGEYLIVAPNGNGNVARGFFYSNRKVGAQVTLPGITFPEAPHFCESKCEKCGKCLDAECAEEACAEKCEGHAHECENVCATCGKCQNAECKEEVCAEKCACHECESVCAYCGGCTDAECAQAACATKCPGHEGSMFLTIGAKKFEAVAGKWAINQPITTATATSHAVWVFTKDYTGEFSTNGYGVAVVLDQYGRVIRVYDGANGGYWLPDGKQASAHFDVNSYATTAWAELQAGEYLVVLPNGGSEGNAARQVGLDCRYLFNQKLNITGIEYASPEMTIQIGAKVYTAELGKWAINEAITTGTAASKAIWVFTKAYEGEFSTNGYGVAVVLDQFGRVIRIYDGANGGYWLPDGKQASAHFDVNSYATTAWAELQAGEYLVVLPNGGSEGNAARQVGLDCRYLFNQKLNITGIEYASPEMTIQIGAKVYTAELGKWAINEAITTGTAASKAIWVFTKAYEGEFSTNGYGVAVVLDQFGRVIRIYDGANGGYWLPDGKQASAHFDVNSYATTAWAELQEGETLIVLPNGGSDGNAARQIGLDCRYLFNQKMSVTGIAFAE